MIKGEGGRRKMFYGREHAHIGVMYFAKVYNLPIKSFFFKVNF